MMKEELCWRYAHPCGSSAVAELFTLLKTAEEMKMKRTICISVNKLGHIRQFYEHGYSVAKYLCVFGYHSFALNMGPRVKQTIVDKLQPTKTSSLFTLHEPIFSGPVCSYG